MFKRVLLASGILFASASVIHAQTSVNVTIDANSSVRSVDERMFGVNSTMWDEASSLEYSATNLNKTIQAVQEAGIRFVRLPGGSNSDTYHWYENKPFDQTSRWAAGFNSSSKLVRDAQTQAIVTVNYGTGTPEEAAAWVAYANFSTTATTVNIGGATEYANVYRGAGTVDFKDASYWANLRAASPLATDDGLNFLRLGLTQPMGIKYWEIGNEVYGAAWETDKHTPANEPYTYASNAAAFITKMKAVDPTIKIGVVVETGENTYGNGNTDSNGNCVAGKHSATNLTNSSVHCGWTPIVLATLKQLGATPDFLIYHRYDQAPGVLNTGSSESDSGLLQSMNTRSWTSDATDLRNQITNYFGTGGQNIELVVTENNSVYSNPGRQSTSLVNALFMADSIGNIMQSEFNGLVWWALRNGPPSSSNLSTSLYGWRNYGDYGILSFGNTSCLSNVITCNSTFFEKFPNYYSLKLMSFFARDNDTVVSASSNNNLLAVYGTKRASDSSMSLLVINKSPTATANVQFTISGFTPGASANVYTYGIPNDNASNPLIGTGCKDITSSTVNTGSTFSGSFAPYSINVLTFNRDESARMSSSSPTFVAQPANSSLTAGASASFTASAAGCPVPTYQWQRMANGTSSWTDISDGSGYSGSTTSTLTVVTTVGMSGDQFRLNATNSTTVNSNAATLTVSAASSSSSSSAASSSSASPPPSSGGGGGGSFTWQWLLALSSFFYFARLVSQRKVAAACK